MERLLLWNAVGLRSQRQAKNTLIFRKHKPWVTIVAALLCLLFLISCAGSSKNEETGSKNGNELKNDEVPKLIYELFMTGGGMILQIIVDGAASQEYVLTEHWYADRFQVLLNGFHWEKSKTADIGHYSTALSIYSNDRNSKFTFFAGSDLVLYASAGVETWYTATDKYGADNISNVMRSEFNRIESAFWNTPPFYAAGTDFENIAYQFMENYAFQQKNLSAGNEAKITDLDVLELEVFLTEEGNNDKFGFRCSFAVKPVQYDSPHWWMFDHTAGTGAYEGWVILAYEFRLDRDSNDYWHCTSMETGGLTLD